jgi:hypothetical protein
MESIVLEDEEDDDFEFLVPIVKSPAKKSLSKNSKTKLKKKKETPKKSPLKVVDNVPSKPSPKKHESLSIFKLEEQSIVKVFLKLTSSIKTI